MTDMIVVYVPCIDIAEAKKIGNHVMNKRLAPCYNIIQNTFSAAFWPPETGEIEEISGAVLLLKSVEANYSAIERAVRDTDSDTNPCIISFPVLHVSEPYYRWLTSEMKKS